MRHLVTLLLLIAIPCSKIQAEEPVISDVMVAIANPSVDLGNQNERSIKNAFLGRTTTWDGVPVVLVLSRESSSKEAIKAFTGRDHDRLLRGWKRLTFSGNGSMPKVVDTDAQAIDLIRTTRGAIFITLHQGQAPHGTEAKPLTLTSE